MTNDTKILMAEIVGVHGIKGQVKLKVFASDPMSLPDYSPFIDDAGKEIDITHIKQHGNIYLATLKDLRDRTLAEKLRGVKLYTGRDNLPDIAEEDTFYHSDLVGLAVKHTDGNPLGTLVHVANFGAGDLFEIKPQKGASFYVPFTKAIVTSIDLQKKEVVINPPPGLLD